MATVTWAHVIIPIGYVNLFKPVIQSVMDHYRPTCIVLQVTMATSSNILSGFQTVPQYIPLV